jgi:hypothetical protein
MFRKRRRTWQECNNDIRTEEQDGSYVRGRAEQLGTASEDEAGDTSYF